MHKTIRSLTLIALLCTAPVQAQPSSAQLAVKGLIKILVGSCFVLPSLNLGVTSGICAAGGLVSGQPEILAFSLLPGAGSAGFGAASFFLIRSGWRDLNQTPGGSKKKKTKEEEETADDDDDWDDEDEDEDY